MISSKLLAGLLPKAASVSPALMGAAAPASSALMHRQMASAAEATFDTKPYKLHKLDTPIAAQGSLTRDDALLYYRQMAVIR